MALVEDNPKRVSDVLKMDTPLYTREEVVILSGEGKLEMGTVLAKLRIGAATSAAKSGGNTGNGTLVMDPTTPALKGAEPGIYTARFTTTTNIRLEAPDGKVLGDIAIGGTTGNTATVNEKVKAVVTQGATPFAAGDGFDITVAPAANKYVGLKLTGANAGHASAVLISNVDATSADAKGVVVARGPVEVVNTGLVWPDTITDADKAAAIEALEARGIVIRTAA